MKKRQTAAEVQAQLENDPKFVKEREERERVLSQRERELQQQEIPLLGALRAVGIEVTSVWDLVNQKSDYPAAVPILFDHVGHSYPVPIREGIARALGTASSRKHWSKLVALYKSENDERVKDGFAAALAAIADLDHTGELIGLVRDSRNGMSRVLLLRPLARTTNAAGRDELQRLRRDPLLGEEATFLLRTVK
jgi:hypothetical protein